MKVTFTCEKCGHVFREYEPVVNDFYIYQHQSDYQCPNCTKLSYGPLTEEMVAEALAAASDHTIAFAEWLGEYQDEFIREARFVLRLLKECVKSDSEGTVIGPDVRDWLLDLARKP